MSLAIIAEVASAVMIIFHGLALVGLLPLSVKSRVTASAVRASSVAIGWSTGTAQKSRSCLSTAPSALSGSATSANASLLFSSFFPASAIR